MAKKPISTAPAAHELPLWQALLVVLTPIWIIAATLANALLSGEVAL